MHYSNYYAGAMAMALRFQGKSTAPDWHRIIFVAVAAYVGISTVLYVWLNVSIETILIAAVFSLSLLIGMLFLIRFIFTSFTLMRLMLTRLISIRYMLDGFHAPSAPSDQERDKDD
jgi:hypothetical protein